MDPTFRMQELLDYIEDHLDREMDVDRISQISGYPYVILQRVFSYLSGRSLSEYIRKRRLSKAAFELQTTDGKVIDIAMRYGYDSPEAFSRAFKQQHGVLPSEARSEGIRLKTYSKLSFQIILRGDIAMEFRIVKKDAFDILGYYGIKKPELIGFDFSEGAWRIFMNEFNVRLRDQGFYTEPLFQVGYNHQLADGNIEMAIGAEADGRMIEGMTLTHIPAFTYAVFTITGPTNIGLLDRMLMQVHDEWMPQSGYQYADNFFLDCYGPGNAESDDYQFELWVPVVKAE